MSFIIEALGRWAEFKNLNSRFKDDYDWEHTWGYRGEFTDRGNRSEIKDGMLWLVEYMSDMTGKTYPRLVFSETRPQDTQYLEVRPARINLNGITFRAGLKISF